MAAYSTRNQLPTAFKWFENDKITQPAAFYLQQLQANAPAPGSTGITTTTGPMTLNWGLDVNKGSPVAGNIYFATDTGKIYVGDGSTYHLESPALTGDVTKPVGSSVVTLNSVNFAPGTWGSSTSIPSITVDAKGRITNVITNPVIGGGGVTVAGTTGNIQFNGGSILAAVPNGSTGQVLSTDGLIPQWINNPGAIDVIFNYGDASPRLLFNAPANKAIINVSILILTSFNGTGATLSVGTLASPQLIMASTDNAPSILSTWSNNPNTVFGINTGVYLTITPGSGATQGSGLITITVQQ